MKSYLSRKRPCSISDKVRYETQEDAERAIKRSVRRARDEGSRFPCLSTYLCVYCEGHHLTSH